VNCSPAGIDAGVCVGIDGTTSITLASAPGWDGTLVAVDIVPMPLRPYSDFEWRSDPHQVNGTGSANAMDPGGDFLGAYWLGRMVDLDDPSLNITNHPRAPYVDPDAGVHGGTKDGGPLRDAMPDAELKDAMIAKDAAVQRPDGGGLQGGSGACGCEMPGGERGGALAAEGLLLLATVLAIRRRA